MGSLQMDNDDEISNLVDLLIYMLCGGWKWQDLLRFALVDHHRSKNMHCSTVLAVPFLQGNQPVQVGRTGITVHQIQVVPFSKGNRPVYFKGTGICIQFLAQSGNGHHLIHQPFISQQTIEAKNHSNKTEAGTTSTTLSTRLPILNPGEYDLWLMRIEQYFLMTDYSLYEVILNGNKVLKRAVREVEQEYEPTSAEENQDRRNEMKARGTLLMALIK
ncbi:hypothetical protein Tco_0564670 [Tanacetum coccineum]